MSQFDDEVENLDDEMINQYMFGDDGEGQATTGTKIKELTVEEDSPERTRKKVDEDEDYEFGLISHKSGVKSSDSKINEVTKMEVVTNDAENKETTNTDLSNKLEETSVIKNEEKNKIEEKADEKQEEEENKEVSAKSLIDDNEQEVAEDKNNLIEDNSTSETKQNVEEKVEERNRSEVVAEKQVLETSVYRTSKGFNLVERHITTVVKQETENIDISRKTVEDSNKETTVIADKQEESTNYVETNAKSQLKGTGIAFVRKHIENVVVEQESEIVEKEKKVNKLGFLKKHVTNVVEDDLSRKKAETAEKQNIQPVIEDLQDKKENKDDLENYLKSYHRNNTTVLTSNLAEEKTYPLTKKNTVLVNTTDDRFNEKHTEQPLKKESQTKENRNEFKREEIIKEEPANLKRSSEFAASVDSLQNNSPKHKHQANESGASQKYTIFEQRARVLNPFENHRSEEEVDQNRVSVTIQREDEESRKSDNLPKQLKNKS